MKRPYSGMEDGHDISLPIGDLALLLGQDRETDQVKVLEERLRIALGRGSGKELGRGLGRGSGRGYGEHIEGRSGRGYGEQIEGRSGRGYGEPARGYGGHHEGLGEESGGYEREYGRGYGEQIEGGFGRGSGRGYGRGYGGPARGYGEPARGYGGPATAYVGGHEGYGFGNEGGRGHETFVGRGGRSGRGYGRGSRSGRGYGRGRSTEKQQSLVQLIHCEECKNFYLEKFRTKRPHTCTDCHHFLQCHYSDYYGCHSCPNTDCKILDLCATNYIYGHKDEIKANKLGEKEKYFFVNDSNGTATINDIVNISSELLKNLGGDNDSKQVATNILRNLQKLKNKEEPREIDSQNPEAQQNGIATTSEPQIDTASNHSQSEVDIDHTQEFFGISSPFQPEDENYGDALEVPQEKEMDMETLNETEIETVKEREKEREKEMEKEREKEMEKEREKEKEKEKEKENNVLITTDRSIEELVLLKLIENREKAKILIEEELLLLRTLKRIKFPHY